MVSRGPLQVGDRRVSRVPSLVHTETAGRAFADASEPTMAMQAIHRRQDPEHLVDTFAFLCSPASEWMTGQVVGVDGGLVMR